MIAYQLHPMISINFQNQIYKNMKKDPIFPIFNQWKKEISQVYTLTIFMEIMLKDPNKTLEIIDKLLKDFPNKS